jgi:hypothetical protein
VEEENVERDERQEELCTTADLLALRRFKTLAGEWTSAELGRCFWLTPQDILEVKTCLGAANRLGFALNLLLMRLLHCPFPEHRQIPPRIVRFVAMQLNTHPEALAEYAVQRPQTRAEIFAGSLERPGVHWHQYRATSRPSHHCAETDGYRRQADAPQGSPARLLPADWRTAIEADRASKDPKERRRAKHLLELGLAEQMRKLLRSSDLSVLGSRQHKVWTSYLHTEAAWAERKSSWFARHPSHQDAKTYLDALEERYQTLLQTVLDGWDTNDFAEIVMKDGKATLDLSKDAKLALPATVEPLWLSRPGQ